MCEALNIVWRQCACYVWPLVVQDGWLDYGPCRMCGVAPDYPAATPADGRAHPLPPWAE